MKRRLLVSLIVLALTLLVAELAVGHWYPIGKPTYRMDRTLLFTTIPGSRRIQPMSDRAGGARNLIEIGPQGYRGPALASPKTRPRLAVVGDSFVMAENVSYGRSFPARLSAHLNDRYEVVSVGASGYGPDQALLRLQKEWSVLDPDLVLLVLCATNDHGDVVRNKLYRLDQAGRLHRKQPTLGPDVIADFERWADRGRDLALVRLVRAFMREDGSDEQADYMSLYLQVGADEWQDHLSREPTVHDLFRDYYDADLALAPESESALGKRALMGALMDLWGQEMQKRQTPLRILIVPSAVDLDPTFNVQVDRERFSGYDPRAQTDAFLGACRRSGAPTYDVFDLFSANDPAELFVGFDDIHWNERGIDLAAKDVAEWLDGL